MKKRKILGVTGIRSEYDIMSTVFRAISLHPKLRLELIVSGAHLSNAYGNTINEIIADKFTITDEIESLINSDRLSSRVKGLSIQLQGMIQSVARVKPDILIVLGDREEAMATALIGAYMNVPVAHVGGGDRVVGNVDDQIRHAVTKLVHIHFVTNSESHDRIIRLGEQPFRVYNVGNPGLDRIINTPHISVKELSKRIGFEISEGEPYLLLIQHVISSEFAQAYSQMKKTLEAVERVGLKTIVIYPNSDAGSEQIIKAIDEYKERPRLYVARNIPRLEFINIMRNVKCLVGNSSAGILEAPLLKLPVVNVGNRQYGRLHAENVQFVSHNVSEIVVAIRKAVYDGEYRDSVAKCKNPYGDGHSSQRIAELLATIPLDSNLLIKDITF